MTVEVAVIFSNHAESLVGIPRSIGDGQRALRNCRPPEFDVYDFARIICWLVPIY